MSSCVAVLSLQGCTESLILDPVQLDCLLRQDTSNLWTNSQALCKDERTAGEKTCVWMSDKSKRIVLCCPEAVVHLFHGLQYSEQACASLCGITHLQKDFLSCQFAPLLGLHSLCWPVHILDTSKAWHDLQHYQLHAIIPRKNYSHWPAACSRKLSAYVKYMCGCSQQNLQFYLITPFTVEAYADKEVDDLCCALPFQLLPAYRFAELCQCVCQSRKGDLPRNEEPLQYAWSNILRFQAAALTAVANKLIHCLLQSNMGILTQASWVYKSRHVLRRSTNCHQRGVTQYPCRVISYVNNSCCVAVANLHM